MGLTLLAGPANAGKVELLLDRYLAALEQDPVLIVPNRPDVDWAERELLRRSPALLGGSITTFDGVFDRIAAGDPDTRPVAADVQQTLALRAAVAKTALNGLGESARSAGFSDALRDAIGEVESGLVAPEELEGPLARLYASYREELDSLGLWDRHQLRAAAAHRLANELDAWEGHPVFAYGFEDLTETEWALIRALAGRSEVTVSLPYEPGRPAFEWLGETSTELARLADGSLTELGPRYAEVAHPALAYLERGLFGSPAGDPPALEGAIRFFEGAGTRGSLELVGEEILQLLRDGAAPQQVGVVVPSQERWRAPLETAFSTLGIPYAIDAPARLPQTPFGQALLSLLRFAWSGAERPELFRYLRSPYSGLRRGSVDFVEGRLRGRAIEDADRVEEELEALREARLPALDAVRSADSPVEAVRELAGSMVRNAYGLEEPPVGEMSRDDLRAYEGCRRVLHDLEGWERIATPVSREDVLAALDRAAVRATGAMEAGRVPILDLSRARTRRFQHLVRDRPRGRKPPAPFAGDAVPRRRRAAADRQQAPAGRHGCPRPVPLLHRLHPLDRAAVPRPRGRDGRREPEGGEPVLGGGRRRVPGGGRAALDDSAAAVFTDVEPRGCADRARAAPYSCRALGGRSAPRRRGGHRERERLVQAPGARKARIHPAHAPHASARAGRAGRTLRLQRHRAGALRRLLLGLVLRPRDRPEDDRPGGGREVARLDRALGALPVLQGPAEGARHRPCGARAGRGRRPFHGRLPRAGIGRRPRRDDRAPAPRAAADARAGPRAPGARRGGDGAVAPAEQVRGVVRLRALRAGAPARPRARGRRHPVGEDRPDRRRPVQRSRDRPGLQVGKERTVSTGHRQGAAAPDPALHARAPRPRRDRAARRRLSPPVGRPRTARPAPRRGQGGRSPGVQEGGLPRRGGVLARRSRAPRRPRGASPAGSGKATSSTIPRAGTALPGATSGRCAG